MTNCAKVTPARSASAAVALEGRGPVARQAEDERAQHVDAVRAERLQPLDERLAGRLKPL